jgi:release factor glutamine methyltransferase
VSLTAELAHPEVVAAAARRLEAAGVPSPEVDARWLVAHVVEVAGAPTGCGAALLDGLVARRCAREPLQLVLGSTAFRTLELACEPGVFVPRPETEVVAGEAIAAARAVTGRRPRVVDVGTGTGAIALAVAAEVVGAEVVAVDVDEGALALARRNLDALRSGAAGTTLAPGASVEVRRSSLLDDVPAAWRAHLDVLVSNPPYLPAADRGSWDPEVGDHDPDRALVGGEDGHELVDALLYLAARWLAPGGTVVVELDERRGADALARARQAGLVDVRLLPDLTGVDRAVVGRRPPVPGASTHGTADPGTSTRKDG